MPPEEIEELMQLKGWNQAQLAKRLGMSEGTISLWLRGHRNMLPPTAELLRLLLAEARKQGKPVAARSA